MRKQFSNDNVAQECAAAIACFDLEKVAWRNTIPNPNRIQQSFIKHRGSTAWGCMARCVGTFSPSYTAPRQLCWSRQHPTFNIQRMSAISRKYLENIRRLVPLGPDRAPPHRRQTLLTDGPVRLICLFFSVLFLGGFFRWLVARSTPPIFCHKSFPSF